MYVVSLVLFATFLAFNLLAEDAVCKGECGDWCPLHQFFGSCTTRNDRLPVPVRTVQCLMWLVPPCAVEHIHGAGMAFFLYGVAFLNFGATIFYREAPGRVRYHPCCSSYAYFTFIGAALVCVARYIARVRWCALLLLSIWVGGCISIAVMEERVFHHAFPLASGGIVFLTIRPTSQVNQIGSCIAVALHRSIWKNILSTVLLRTGMKRAEGI